MFHKSEMKRHAGDPGADRRQLDTLVGIDARRVGGDDRDQQHALVQHAIVPQVVGQGERDAGASPR